MRESGAVAQRRRKSGTGWGCTPPPAGREGRRADHLSRATVNRSVVGTGRSEEGWLPTALRHGARGCTSSRRPSRRSLRGRARRGRPSPFACPPGSPSPSNLRRRWRRRRSVIGMLGRCRHECTAVGVDDGGEQHPTHRSRSARTSPTLKQPAHGTASTSPGCRSPGRRTRVPSPSRPCRSSAISLAWETRPSRRASLQVGRCRSKHASRPAPVASRPSPSRRSPSPSGSMTPFLPRTG